MFSNLLVRKLTRKSTGRIQRSRSLEIEPLEPRQVLSTSYLVHDLVSDQPGVAPILDPNLVNGWGVALSPTAGGFWVSSNGKDISTIYAGDVGGTALSKAPLEVNIPGGAPTGIVFNSTSDFVVQSGADSGPATFIFASESGAVTGWNPNVPLPATSTDAQPAFQAGDGAVYKGIALADNGGSNFLYVADFHNNKIDVLDSSFSLTTLSGSFTDPNLPAGYAPFNVAAIGGQLYVSYALQNADQHDDVAGAGHGLIDIYTTDGVFVQRLVTGGKLNSPWAMVQASANFGDFSNDLLVGNFGNGRINAYDPTTGAFLGTLSSSPGHPVVTGGLWGLAFGNGNSAGDADTLYFAAGPGGESHGLFGKITANAPGTSPVQAVLSGDTLTVSGSRGNDNILVWLNPVRNRLIVSASGKQIGSFDPSTIATIEVFGLLGRDIIQVSPLVHAAAIINGGTGNDILLAGGGSSVMLGGPGDDIMIGGAARDIMIGGSGRDLLLGVGGDDILIGGSTDNDANTDALLQILGEWTSSDSFSVRVSNLKNGIGVPMLDDSTVTDDGVRDLLLGGPGQNWLFHGTHDLLVNATAT